MMRQVLLLLLLATLEGGVTPALQGQLASPWRLTASYPSIKQKLDGLLVSSGVLACFGRPSPSCDAEVSGAGSPPFLEPEDLETREKRLQRSRIAIAVLAQIADDREAMDSCAPRFEDTLFEVRGVDTGGVRIPNKMTHDDVVHLMEQLYKHKQRLHASALEKLLAQASYLLNEEPNLVRIPAGRRVTVVGDVHGSLSDINRIFQLSGWPGENNTYIFNGDFVDRGDRGVEVLGVLFALKVVHPCHVFLNRGNHEDFKICRVYGFWEEFMSKYGNRALYKRICDIFALLPLGCIIGDEILVVHAGLPRSLSVTLSDINDIPRKQLRSTVRAGGDGANRLFGGLLCGLPSPIESKMAQSLNTAEDLLWSDPLNPQDLMREFGTADMCLEPNHARGAGTKYGPGVARVLLGKWGLKTLVRVSWVACCLGEGWIRGGGAGCVVGVLRYIQGVRTVGISWLPVNLSLFRHMASEIASSDKRYARMHARNHRCSNRSRAYMLCRFAATSALPKGGRRSGAAITYRYGRCFRRPTTMGSATRRLCSFSLAMAGACLRC
jgi:diadenosine tetraphosphatase ApaH/serine/threonine PP2A family protein phosphatase